jgi:hypothetical protein
MRVPTTLAKRMAEQAVMFCGPATAVGVRLNIRRRQRACSPIQFLVESAALHDPNRRERHAEAADARLSTYDDG